MKIYLDETAATEYCIEESEQIGVPLPIDISAIGREGHQVAALTHRFGGNLFTYDAQRVNEVLAGRILERQESALLLFDAVAVQNDFDVYDAIRESSVELALFSRPMSFGDGAIVESEASLSNLTIVVVLVIFAIIGVILAVIIQKRKRVKRKN
jgi:hypothetical protein